MNADDVNRETPADKDASLEKVPLLEAINLRRETDERVLLNDVSLSIYSGDRIGILGPTGSGKTVLLRSLALLDPLDGGEILWNGKRICGQEVPKFRSQVVYLHQRPALNEGTVEDNLRQPFTLGIHQEKQFQRDKIVALLETLNQNESFLTKQQQDLSGGEAQLTALIRAIQLDPNILLLDEPTAALDSDSTNMVEQLITRWLDETSDGIADEQIRGRATVWVTHDQQQSQRVCTSTLKIREGKFS